MGTTRLGQIQIDASALSDHDRVGSREIGSTDQGVGATEPTGVHRIVMALAFYPRGGSAQVARYLARALSADGLEVTLCCGSLGSPGDNSHAATFFRDLALEPVDFNDAMAAFKRGEDPMVAPLPMQPSFEDRPGAPDRIFASLGPDDYERQVGAWADRLRGTYTPDLYHVHHLTHVNDAIHSLGATPVVVQLHGTELKMLAAIEADASRTWHHAEAWQRRLRRAARRADRLIANSPSIQRLASNLLEIEPGLIDVIPNGVDVDHFTPGPLPTGDRMKLWRRWLVEEPLGWDQSGQPGTVRYTDDDLERCFHHPETGLPLPVLIFAGRFLRFKRVPLLLDAYTHVRAALGPSTPPLVIWGGYPGEWEGTHPHTVAKSMGTDGIFFAGWRGHNDLAQALKCADIFVAPSTDEPFGQVYLEAMAAGLPVIGTKSGGPPSFINTDRSRLNGWMVTPDCSDELAGAIEIAVNDRALRRERGQHGRHLIERSYDWRRIASQYEDVYTETVARHCSNRRVGTTI